MESRSDATREGATAMQADLRGRGPRPLGLVVCRDDTMRRATVSALADAGYNVMEASDGRSAMHLCIDHGERLEVAIIEERFGVMGGHPLTAFVRRYFPTAAILLIAGPSGGGGLDGDDAEASLFEYAPSLRMPVVASDITRHLEAARAQAQYPPSHCALRGNEAGTHRA